MITLEQAVVLATKAHEGQWLSVEGSKRFSKKQFITRPLAVMEMMSTNEEKLVAILHYMIKQTEAFIATRDEQGYILVYDKKSYLIDSKVFTALNLLTHNKTLSYIKYIKFISCNKLATKVKIADFIWELSNSPLYTYKQKYLKAIPVLLKSL